MSLHYASVADVVRRVQEGNQTAAAWLENSLERIDRLNPALGAMLTTTRDAARERAREIDAKVMRGEDPGILAGVPVAVKDNLCTKGVPTTAGSRILEHHRPLYDATVVTRLRRAGAVMVGKTNLDEFSMGSSTENSAFGPAKNPWDVSRVPGGSSGGSAVAVASGMAGLSLGSDTGGSIRQPAALTGLYGLKPTYGRVSRFGLIAFASSLDQVGGFARDPESLCLLYRAISGHDARDSTSEDRPVEPVDPGAGVQGLSVGLAADLLAGGGVQPEVAEATRKAAEALAAAGASIEEVTFPQPEIGIGAYYLLATAEASSNLARYDGVRYGLRLPGDTLEAMYRKTRHEGFGPEVKRRIMLGTYALSAGYYDAYYVRAQRTRSLIRRRFASLFEKVDMLLLPTTPTTAFALGEKIDDPLAMYLGDVFTVFANLTGMPGMSVPVGTDTSGLPIGVQVMAPHWCEETLFRAAGTLARSAVTSWPEPEEGS